MQYSPEVRDSGLDARVRTVGPAPILELRSAKAPTNCKAKAAGTLLAKGQLPFDWMEQAKDGLKPMLGKWTIFGVAKGKIGHFRLYELTGKTCHMQGELGEDMEVDDDSVSPQQVVTVTLFSLRAGNA